MSPKSDPLKKEPSQLNEIASHYDSSPFDSKTRDYMVRTFSPYFQGGKALQMGCFHGDFTEAIAPFYSDLSLVDAVPEFLEHTKQRIGPHLKTYNSLFEDFKPTESFDAIFIIHVLEHLQDPVAILKKAREWLSPGGRIFLAVPNGNAISRLIAVKMGIIEQLNSLTPADIKHGHRHIYFLDQLQNQTRQAGFSLLSSGGIFFEPLANFQFDGLMDGPFISDAFMEGCFELGKEYPQFCASLYSIAEKR